MSIRWKSLRSPEVTVGRGQCAEIGEIGVGGALDQCDIAPVLLTQPHPEKGDSSGPQSLCCLGLHSVRGVKDRGSKGSDPPSWEPAQGQYGLCRAHVAVIPMVQ